MSRHSSTTSGSYCSTCCSATLADLVRRHRASKYNPSMGVATTGWNQTAAVTPAYVTHATPHRNMTSPFFGQFDAALRTEPFARHSTQLRIEMGLST